MKGRKRATVRAAIGAGSVVWLLVAAASTEQRVQMTTAERLQGAAWWPTKFAAARGDYAGTAACSPCHPTKVESQARTAMARTATRAGDSEVLRTKSVLMMKAGPYSHHIRTGNGTSIYSVSDGNVTVNAVLGWALGVGKVGQTFIFERSGVLYEGRASYFGSIDALDLTPGRRFDIPATIEAAMGRPLPPTEARRCLGCHTTASSVAGVFAPADSTPGVTCEACHGPGRAHVDAMEQHREADGLAAIVNPAGFKAIDSVDFCGSCHATYWDVILAGENGISALRSQPFRLQSSRCWGDEGDRRITCVACHDPHEPLEREPRAYDRRCLACHAPAGAPIRSERPPGGSDVARPAPRAAACTADGRERCAGCHMPKYDVPDMHFSFTDHLIRVVRSQAPVR